MSLVGTRPILPDELEQYELHHRARIAIKPGITGMWQVSGRSDITDFEEIVRLDTEYISEQDIFLIRIQLKIKLDDGCKAFHTTSQICVIGSQVDPAKPRSIIQHERSLRSVTGVLLKRNWISLQKPILSG